MSIDFNKISYGITTSVIAFALIMLIYNNSPWYFTSAAAAVLVLKLMYPFIHYKPLRIATELTITAAMIFGIVMLLISSNCSEKLQ